MTLRLGGDGAITGCTSLENPDLTVSGLTISGSFDAEKVLVSSGTAAAPSYTFSGDTDNGLYYAGTNSIGLSTAGTNALLIDSGGNVAIGTTSAGHKLVVKGTAAFEATNSTNAWLAYTYTDNTFRLNYNGAGADEVTIDSAGFINQTFTSNNSSTPEGLFINNQNNVTGNNASLILSNDSGNRKKVAIAAVDVGNYGASDLVFALDGADSGSVSLSADEKMRLDSSGNVGIGTASPTQKLDVRGNIYVGDKIGINTTSPSQFLDIESGSSTSARITAHGYICRDNWGSASSLGNGMMSPATNSLAFTTNSNERMRITSAGGVGIGTSSPTNTLHVNGSTYVENNLTIGAYDTSPYLRGMRLFPDNSGRSTLVLNGDGTSNTAIGIYDGYASGYKTKLLHDGGGYFLGDIIIGTTSAATNANLTVRATSPQLSLYATPANVSRITLGDTDDHDIGQIGYDNSDNSMFFGTNNATRMSIKSSGAVTVTRASTYTTGLQHGLAIQQGSATNGNRAGLVFKSLDGFDVAGVNGVISTHSGTQNNNVGYLEFYTKPSGVSAPVERMRIDSSGRVLINHTADTAPAGYASKLQLCDTSYQGSSMLLRRDQNNSSAPTLLFTKTRSSSKGGSTIVQSNDLTGQIAFFAGDGTDANCMTGYIASAVDGTPGSNDMPGRLTFHTTLDGATSPTEQLLIRANGLLQSPPTYSSTTSNAANVSVDSNGYFQRSTSSAKYKTDIETLEDSYSDALLNCRPVWYRSTCKRDNPEYGWWGFIAEEVAEIDPRLVHWKTTEISYDEKGSTVETPCDPEAEGVAYDRFVPHLLNLIKRQKEQLETLESEVAALKNN